MGAHDQAAPDRKVHRGQGPGVPMPPGGVEDRCGLRGRARKKETCTARHPGKVGKIFENFLLAAPEIPLTTRDSVEAKQTARSEEHTSELQSLAYLVCRLLLEKKKNEL